MAFACVCALSLSALASWAYKGQIMERLDRIEAQETKKMMTTKWMSGGEERTWTSTWKQYDPDEDLEVFFQRHKDEVAAAKRAFPKDP